MADGLTATVDAAALLAALDRVPASVARRVKAAAKVTAERIKTEAAARRRRATTGPGETARRLTVEETDTGYLVYVQDPRVLRDGRLLSMPNLPIWLEYGTKKMYPRPFLLPAAAIEEGPHLRRIAEAVQAAIDETGLGE